MTADDDAAGAGGVVFESSGQWWRSFARRRRRCRREPHPLSIVAPCMRLTLEARPAALSEQWIGARCPPDSASAMSNCHRRRRPCCPVLLLRFVK